MWIDKITYWKFVYTGEDQFNSLSSPTIKTIDYATINTGMSVFKLAIGVYDDDKYTPINRDELAFYLTQHSQNKP